MKITTELIDALLSPDTDRRRNAETVLEQSYNNDARGKCVALLDSVCGGDNNPSSRLPPHYEQFVAVLLRRTILQITDVNFLRDIALPRLLQSFVSSTPNKNDNKLVQNALGHCLSEICSVLSWCSNPTTAGAGGTNGGNSNNDMATRAVQTILQGIATSASHGDVASLQLLIGLSERAPIAYVQTPQTIQSIPQLIHSALECTSQQQQQHQSEEVVCLLTELVVTSAMAVVSAGTTSNKNEADKIVAQLGADGLNRLIPCIGASFSSNAVRRILQHWNTAAEYVPWLLAGHPHVLESVVGCCLNLAASHSTSPSSAFESDHGAAPVSLQAVQVLMTLAGQGHVRRQAITPAIRGAVLEKCTHVCLNVALEADRRVDIDEWASEPATLAEIGGGVDDNEEIASYAEDLIEHMIRAFGGQALTAAVLPAVEGLLSSCCSSNSNDGSLGQQQQARVALAVLQRCLFAAPKAFRPHVATALHAGLHYSNTANANVRVQYQAIGLLGIICENAGSAVVSGTAPDLVCQMWRAFAHGAQSPCSKVAALACTAMVAFCRPSDPATTVDPDTVVVPYLSDVLAALSNGGPLGGGNNSSASFCDSGSLVVKIRAVGAVACLAEVAQEQFASVYKSVMPGILACADAQPAPGASAGYSYELIRLRGSAIEAATIIGQSVGEDHANLFLPDAERILQTAVSILRTCQDGGNANSDDQDVVAGIPMDLLLSACARIASVMKEAYAPYAGIVLPHLLKRATNPSDVEISESDVAASTAKLGEVQMDDDTGIESVTVAVPGRGLQKVTVNTTKIQEKSTAIRAIYEHATALGAAFGPYCTACLDAFIPLVQFKFSSDLRGTAAQTVAAVYEAACSYGESSESMDVARRYLPLVARTVASQIVQEDGTNDSEALYALAEALSAVLCSAYHRLEDCGDQLVADYSVDCATDVVQFSMRAMSACLERRAKITSVIAGAEGALSGEDEQDDLIRSLDSEEELLTPLVDSVGYSLKILRQDFIPLFELYVMPILGPYLRAGHDVRARLAAVCLFDDCVEFCGTAAAARFSPILLEGVMAGISDSNNGGDLELKRASIYGIAQIARHAPSNVLTPYEDKILPPLLLILSGPKPVDDDLSAAVFENAVSALASLTIFGNAPLKSTNFIKPALVVDVVLKNLPLLEDYDESKFCNAALCDLVEKSGLPLDSTCKDLYRIIGETLALIDADEDLASPETIVRFAGIIFRLNKDVDQSLIGEAFDSLSFDAQTALKKAQSQYSH